MTTAIRTQRFIAILSVVLFLGKLWAWYLTRSVSVLTDALESTVNVAAGFIGLYSITLAARPRDANHPYGHGKAEFVSAAIEGALISAAGLLIIYEAIHKLLHPTGLGRLDAGLIIIAATGLINWIVGSIARGIATRRRSATLEAAGRHLMTDAYSTAGIVLGLVLVYFTEWYWLDAVVALCFAFFIIYSGYKVLRRSLAGIMDEADMALLQEVVAFLQKSRRPQWIDMHNLRVIQYGDVLHVDAHMTLPWYYEVRDAEREIHAMEDEIAGHFGGKVEMFIHVDACAPYSCKLCTLAVCPVRQEEFRQRLDWTLDIVMKDSKHGKE